MNSTSWMPNQAIASALRLLVLNPETRQRAVDSIGRAVADAEDPEYEQMAILAWMSREELRSAVDRLSHADYRFDSAREDSVQAHQQMADIQRILLAFGYDLGANGIDGYMGGPPGPPVALELDDAAKLVSTAVPGNKLMSDRTDVCPESWTRDATRRLQTFLGRSGIPSELSQLKSGCLARPDGLFGARTLAGVDAFLTSLGMSSDHR